MFEVIATIGSEIYVKVYGEDLARKLTAAEYHTLQCEMNEFIPATRTVVAPHQHFVRYLAG